MLLILAHGFACRVIPFAVWLFVQGPGFDQRLLDFQNSFGLKMDARVVRPALVAPVMEHASVRNRPASVCFLFLPGAHRRAGQEQKRCGNRRRASDP